jgi:hypothetical protein
MNQRRMILAVVAIGVVSGAIWVWHESSQPTDVAHAPVKAQPQIQDAFHQPTSASVAVGEPAPTTSGPPSATSQPAPVAPGVDQNVVSAQGEPPNVDTPEPAQRKFARGERADEPSQN